MLFRLFACPLNSLNRTFVILGKIMESKVAAKAIGAITKKTVERLYSAIIGTAASGEINSAIPEEVAKMYVEVIIASFPADSRAINVVIG